MMKEPDSLTGQFLVAMPGMGDQRFRKAVIYLCAHARDGAMGFIVNHCLSSPGAIDFLRQLDISPRGEGRAEALASCRLHNGGPVEQGRGFVLHSPDYRSQTTLEVDERVSLTATLDILRAIASGEGPERILLALGYSGWAGGQLESEIVANGWLTAPGDASILFDPDDEAKYERVLTALGVDASSLACSAGHA